MLVRFLGTAAAEGIPGLHCTCEVCEKATMYGGKDIRGRSSILVDDDLMIDFGPDSFRHKIEFRLSYDRVKTLLITHDHGDHFMASEILYRTEVFANRPPKMQVYGNERVGDALEKNGSLKSASVAFSRVTHGDVIEAPNARVTALRGLHDRSQECLLYLIERDGKTVLHGNDTGIFPDETFEALKGRALDAVWLDCTMMGKKEGTNHMGILDCKIVRDRLCEIGAATDKTAFIITHFSHNGGMMHHELEAAARPLGFQVAYDGMILQV